MNTRKSLFHSEVLLFSWLLAVGPVSAQVRDPLPVPDLPGYRTLKCDFHMHTVFSDGDVWPTIRVQEAWRDGLDAISLTDHDDYNPHKADVGTNLARPYEIARTLAAQLGLLLVLGAEITKGEFHLNALFVTEPNAFRDKDLLTAARLANQQKAFVFWNHPGWKRTAEWFPPIAVPYDEGLIKGIELINGRTFYKEAFPWIADKRLTIIANSDVHRLIASDYGPRERPVTLVFVKNADLFGLREALDAHRTAAWVNGEVWGDQSLLKGIWQGAVIVENPGLAFSPGTRQMAIRFHNRSAIPFRPKILKAPDWLRMRLSDLKEEKITGALAEITKDAPAGQTVVELELEITNLHVAPQKELTVTVPLTVEVRR